MSETLQASKETPQASKETPQASKEEQNWAMYCHLAALAGFIVPFGNVVGPLVVWSMKKDTMPLVAQHGKESLNFQITVLIALIIAGATTLILIGFLLLPVVGIGALVLTIMAAVKVSNGQLDYKYPFALRLIK